MSVFHSAAHTRRAFAGRFAALVGALTLTSTLVPFAQAHDTDCPYCTLKVVQDTPTQDNEVALRYGRKRIEYRCVLCAIADINRGTYKDSDLTILAPSETKGKPIPLLRQGGKWSAPEGTVFVAVKSGHEHCQATYRAFSSKTAFDAYVKKNATLLKDAKPVTLAELVTLSH